MGTMFVDNMALLPIAPWAIENIGPRLLVLCRIAVAMSPVYTAGDFDAPPA